MIPIDKNLSLPEPKRGGKSKYPWRELGIGDSFLAPVGVRISGQTSIAGKKYHRRFVSRTVQEGTRVWRVE